MKGRHREAYGKIYDRTRCIRITDDRRHAHSECTDSVMANLLGTYGKMKGSAYSGNAKDHSVIERENTGKQTFILTESPVSYVVQTNV